MMTALWWIAVIACIGGMLAIVLRAFYFAMMDATLHPLNRKIDKAHHDQARKNYLDSGAGSNSHSRNLPAAGLPQAQGGVGYGNSGGNEPLRSGASGRNNEGAGGDLRVDGWQPMATFPRDGEGYLVCNAELAGGDHAVVFFNEAAKDGWCLQLEEGPLYHLSSYTHWMPLPEPPKS